MCGRLDRRLHKEQPRWGVSLLILLLILLLPAWLTATEYDEAVERFRSGDYREAALMAREAVERGEYGENWRLLAVESQMARGDYLTAAELLESARRRYASSLRLRWLGYQLYRKLGESRRAEDCLREIDNLVRRSPWSYGDAASRVVLGRYFLEQEADARRVLELFYDRAKQDKPDYAEAYTAAGQLALGKNDYQMAAREFQQALDRDDSDPEIYYGLGRAYAPSDRGRSEQYFQLALARNPRHIPTLLYAAEQRIDGEQYEEAERLLEEVLAVNPERVEAWALKAVMAHVRNRPDQEQLYRQVALGWWPLNPQVDHLIGRKLSQHYRFAEGATHQRRALRMDPDFRPAKLQLSQDLLRLGEDEGWVLAREVSDDDGYNVVAHNLVRLEQRLARFRTLERAPFLVRMDRQEAEVYGDRVLELLEEAHDALSSKYEVAFDQPIVIEIFPDQQDFAIRTFGLPGGDGFLGVCFGRLVTANSPAALGTVSANWESVLWHEFCHVVTLHKTNNRMPRWLSEGISVYEERLRDPAWGQSMSSMYREMILDGEAVPLSQLSEAFLRPPSSLHLQFAYFEASLAIEFLVDKFGFPALLRMLDDLGIGMSIRETLARHAGSVEVLDQQFADYLQESAKAFGAGIDWSKPDEEVQNDPEALAAWLKDHPETLYSRQQTARHYLSERQWEAALAMGDSVRDDFPEYLGRESGYQISLAAYRGLGDTEGERSVLEELAGRQSDSMEFYLRLMELAEAEEDWEALERNALRAAAVNPLRPVVQQALALAAEKLGKPEGATRAYRAQLALGPIDLAEVHYRLARALYETDQYEEARRNVLQALQEAPRFRAAHRLLLELVEP